MGQKTRRLFDDAERVGGFHGRLRLAMMAGVTSTEAEAVEDSVELLTKLGKALERVQAEFGSKARPEAAAAPLAFSPAGEKAQLKALQRQQFTYLQLMTQRTLFLGDVTQTIRRVNEAAAAALEVERVSVWFVDEKVTKITCADLFERGKAAHTGGVELFAKDFEPYFKALRQERTIAAHDAHTDPRTSCFSAPYLKPLNINSMLDVPIWNEGRMVGVVCHEHVGPARTWGRDEETFGYLMAAFVSLAMERRAHVR